MMVHLAFDDEHDDKYDGIRHDLNFSRCSGNTPAFRLTTHDPALVTCKRCRRTIDAEA